MKSPGEAIFYTSDKVPNDFPEGNVLVSIASVAYKSNTPTSRFVVVTVAPIEMPASTRRPAAQQVAVPA